MYDAVVDPYCYPGTTVLINKLDLRDQQQLDAFEKEITSQRAAEPLPVGHLDASHYCAIHAHLFQDVYDWAGNTRTVRIAKDGNMFCYPEYIDAELIKLFDGLRADSCFRNASPEAYAQSAAHFVAELNAIHPFREGNGRTQLAFLTLLSHHAGHPLHLERMDPERILDAMIRSFEGNETELAAAIAALLG
jgi:cell filamentation protein